MVVVFDGRVAEYKVGGVLGVVAANWEEFAREENLGEGEPETGEL